MILISGIVQCNSGNQSLIGEASRESEVGTVSKDNTQRVSQEAEQCLESVWTVSGGGCKIQGNFYFRIMKNVIACFMHMVIM